MFKKNAKCLILLVGAAAINLKCWGHIPADYQVDEKGNKKGLLDAQGNVLIPYDYDDLGWSTGDKSVEGEVIGYQLEGKWGIVNLENERITRAIYSGIWPWQQDRFIASRTGIYSNKNFYGVLNSRGKAVVGFKYYSITPRENLLLVGIETNKRLLFGLLDRDNGEIIPANYLNIQFLSSSHFAVTNQFKKIGIFESTDRKLSEFELDSISDFQGEYALIYKEGKTGVLNREAKVLIEPFYKAVDLRSKPELKVLSYDKWSFVDSTNNEFNNFFCDSIFPIRNNLYQILVGDAEAIVNGEVGQYHFGRWRISYHEPGVILVKTGTKFGMIDEFGNVILDFVYDSIRYDQGYVYSLKKAGSEKGWSLRNSLGQEIGLVKYQEIQNITERRIMARRKDHWGYLNPVGKEVIACKFSRAENFDGGIARVEYLDGLGVIDRNGNWVVHPYQARIENGPRGLFITKEYFRSFVFNEEGDTIYSSYNLLEGREWGILEKDQGRVGLLNRTGQRILDPVYDRIKPILRDSLFAAWQQRSGGIFDLTGNYILKFNRDYEDILFVSNDYLGVKLDGKYGLIDFKGNLRIANRYDGIRPFEDGLVPIKLRGKWGLVNSSEKLVVQPHYDSIGVFQGGFAIVLRDKKKGMIDKKGKELLRPEFNEIRRLGNGNFLLQKHGKWGLGNQLGHIIEYFTYDSIQELTNGLLIISRKDKWGLITPEGETLIPQIYDYLEFDSYREIYLAQTKADWETLDIQR